ncbi:MAG: cytochrome c biogenesis protein CcdA [Rhizobiaceae bacterium]|nr:cytochrome c biogenesis protein CcdA [Rhizobiaceae bacterium]
MSGDLTLIGIFFAGLLSFISPCVLPLVPPYLTYLAGVSLEEISPQDAKQSRQVQRKALVNAAFFVLGFSCVFVALGAGASSFSQIVRQNQEILSIIAGIIIIVMGLHFLGLFKIGLLYREARFQVDDDVVRGATVAGSFIMGLAFAFGWTPCIGPILGVILGIASARDTVGEGAFMLGVYSMGLGVPFLLAALFAGSFMRFLSRFRKHLGSVEKLMGALLVLTGILFLTGGMQSFAYFLLETFPVMQTFG